MRRFGLNGVAGVMMVVASCSLAWAEPSASSRFSPPPCPPDTKAIHCFAPDMPAAVRVARSDAFRQEIANVAARARAYLATHEPSPKKVIITDLDETLLDNTGYYAKHAEQEPRSWARWFKGHRRKGPFLKPVFNLLQDAKAQGFSVMFITGQSPDMMQAIWRRTRPIAWDGVYFRPKNLSLRSTAYKEQVRNMLTDMGYTIVLNIGDQASDLGGAPDEASGKFLIPNVMYVIP